MTRPLALLFVAAAAASAVAAPVPKPDLTKVWVGRQVVMKESSQTMKVKVGDGFEMVPVGFINPVVLSETATTIEVSHAGKMGTLNKSDVVRPDADGVAYFDKRIAEKPSENLYLHRACLHQMMKKLDLALADYDKAIALDPKEALYIINRGQLHYAHRNFDAALADFNKGLKLNSDVALGYYARAYTYEALRKTDEALADYAKSNELAPDASAHTGAGRVLSSKKEWAKACEQCDAALKLNPKHAPAYLLRSTARFETKDDAGGAADLDEAVTLRPTDPQVRVSRTSALARRGLYAEADRDIRHALRLDPKSDLALNLRAWLSATCPAAEFRDAERAVNAATKACELTEWKTPRNIDTLAAASAEAGKWDEAVKWQKKAIDDAGLFSPDRAAMRKRLALYEAKKPYREPPQWKR